MEYLELSVPIVGSGKFIELHHTGALQNAQPLWAQYFRLRKSLEAVREKLRMCNEPAWLFQFARKWQRQNRDFEQELRRLADSLEKTKNSLEEQIVQICSRLECVDPSLLQAAHTLAGARLFHRYEIPCYGARISPNEVVKRDAIVAKYVHLGSLDLCKRFDVEDLSVPEPWTEKFPEVDCWTKAYKNPVCRNRICKMISQIKRRLRLP
jgi:hypothetical protein